MPHQRRNALWQQFGAGFVKLDRDDRYNGTKLERSGNLANLRMGFVIVPGA